ncbi:DoxX family protein [uncultured Chryseobacterium sp.]|uniref:DoxX family protein n=2 Tax=uncultured Chryseobacterium sp. TaxID=259322 RepID=UPI0025CC135F|nr:DoxX family protein [uncultured Chryseobacterium sp.]
MFYTLQQYKSVQWMIIHIRYLIALAFVPSGFTKVIGERFTQLPKSEAVGQFFEAIYQSGAYYNFLGLAQIITAVLLMTQRFALIGTFLFLAITANIWMITISLPFKGTWIITSLMMFAGLVLLYWDKNRIAALYSERDVPSKKYAPKVSKLWINAGIIYIISLLVLCYAGPKTDPVSKGIAIITYFILGITFLYTNFLFWKTSNHVIQSQNGV